MKPGDLVEVRWDVGTSEETHLLGIVMNCLIDDIAKEDRDNGSTWISGTLLVGERKKNFWLYWDDEYEVLSESR